MKTSRGWSPDTPDPVPPLPHLLLCRRLPRLRLASRHPVPLTRSWACPLRRRTLSMSNQRSKPGSSAPNPQMTAPGPPPLAVTMIWKMSPRKRKEPGIGTALDPASDAPILAQRLKSAHLQPKASHPATASAKLQFRPTWPRSSPGSSLKCWARRLFLNAFRTRPPLAPRWRSHHPSRSPACTDFHMRMNFMTRGMQTLTTAMSTQPNPPPTSIGLAHLWTKYARRLV